MATFDAEMFVNDLSKMIDKHGPDLRAATWDGA